jgi:hypothetical protein
MELYNLTLTEADGWSRVSVSVESKAIAETQLWFSVPTSYQDRICIDRYDPFVVGLLFPAMVCGEDIYVDGSVSESLLHKLNEYAIVLVCSFSSMAKPIRIVARPANQIVSTIKSVGSGFSGGVDSFSTLYNNYVCQQIPSFKIDTLLFFNVGSHGLGDTPEALKFSKDRFLARYNYLKEFPDEVGIDFIPVDSNLHTFHPWGHLLTHTLTSAAAALVFQKTIRRYFYSSTGISYHDMLRVSSRYRNISIGSYCDAVLLPLLSTDSMQLIADGYQYNRTEKTVQILDYPPVKKYLNVCVNSKNSDEKNCSVCPKCCRTLVTLEAAGQLEEFSAVFDISAYRKVRSRYLADRIVKQKSDPFSKYLLDHYKLSGLPMPSLYFVIIAWMKNQVYLFYLKFIKQN